ncbi:sugar phosphate nucleotidyltransferase [Luteolibacter sp. GHJ8]|uniref:Sugar phosphate nucleotidyltransferase n=1 Tax=Luteolibacter rhizosphaerae TaxID=2989719 RepID=A0ABT3G4V9_9BACT|nr:sugar phosphate nucleotidyltransferase [Luteolibacter rhizosphaerae]MCW1914858.1 sugar phosphate nucleotidyltransferase [Luteolibacter rhizosphaerae]
MIRKAFLPGAGLGTRLRPLTDLLPKPLVPLFHRPLIEWAMDSCIAAGITDFAINTHHLPEKWTYAESEDLSLIAGNGLAPRRGSFRDHPLHLFHEPVLLETGGGVKNVASWIGSDSVLVHNGDIYSSIPLDRLIAAHEASDCPVTLALRTEGTATHIALNGAGDRVTDIRSKLGISDGTHVFTGIYCFDPELLDLIPPGEKIAVIPAFLELARQGRLGAIILDEGEWRDLGDHESYLAAHREMALAPAIHPQAIIDPAATVWESVVGPASEIGAGATVTGSVIWPGASVPAGETVENRIVHG